MNQALNVFEYVDYRRLLRDYYDAKKSEGRGFSHRVFARMAGLKSPSHLKRVMDGERSLTDTAATRYAKAMGLRAEEAAYFNALVTFSQAESRPAREAAYEAMRSFRGYRRAHKIDAQYADYHAHWYVPALRELVLRADFDADPAWIARNLVPSITRDEAARALATLRGLRMLVEDPNGRLVQAAPIVSTGEQTRSLHIARYHHAMLERAKESIDSTSADARDVTSLTFCVGPGGFDRVKQRIARFRQELIGMLAEETEGEQVLQLGIQLFPLSTRGGEP